MVLYPVIIGLALLTVVAGGMYLRKRTRPVLTLYCLTLICFYAVFHKQMTNPPQHSCKPVGEMWYRYSVARSVGDTIGRQYPGSRILVISWGYPRDWIHEMLVDAFREGLDSASELVVVKPANEDHYALTAEIVYRVVAENPGCDLVFFPLDQPVDWQELSFWDAEDAPKLCHISGPEPVARVASGDLAAIVDYRPEYVFKLREDLPADYRETFNRRHKLISAKHLAAFALSQSDSRVFCVPELHFFEGIAPRTVLTDSRLTIPLHDFDYSTFATSHDLDAHRPYWFATERVDGRNRITQVVDGAGAIRYP